MKNFKLYIKIALIFIITYIISKYFFQIALVEGNSMAPTYSSNQPILVNKQFQELQEGDVIVFYCKNLNSTLIKRIVATSNDTVVIKNNRLYVNNTESTLVTGPISYSGIIEINQTVPPNSYFVLGDNYSLSKDSRYPQVGFIHIDDIIGKVIPQKSFSN